MKALLTLFCLALPAAPAAGQVFFGAQLSPEAFARAAEESDPGLLNDEAFAWALSAELSSATLYAVFPSTAPEEEISKLLREGLYRQELAALALLAADRGGTARELAGELKKAGSFSALAAARGADAPAYFRRGGALKEAADARMPLFLVAASTAAVRAPPAAAPATGGGR